jgi:hypothetical protein
MMDVRILALMKPGGRATALGIRQSQKLASGFAPPTADVQNINKTSLSRQRLICRNPNSGLFRFSKDTKVKQFLIESPTFSITLRNFRVPNSTNDGTWRLRRRAISPVKLVRPETSSPRPKTICDTAPKGVKGSVRFLSNPIPECTQRNDAGITKRFAHRRDRFADHW